MKKCTLCVDRIYDENVPEAEREGYALMPEWGTKPANHYLPRRITECDPPSPSSSSP